MDGDRRILGAVVVLVAAVTSLTGCSLGTGQSPTIGRPVLRRPRGRGEPGRKSH